MPSKTVINVQDVMKDFRLPHERIMSVKSSLVNVLKKRNRTIETQHVLKGVSFEVQEGDFLGIVGRNGSGKSTLLKILAGIYQPTQGNVSIHGRLVPFIELGVGFNPELTGRENVYLNGALLGFSTQQVDGMYDDIVNFAELGEFMDQKLKNYSSGMQVRLAFSVAIKAQGDILVLDEVLAVGDEAFQRKCNDYFFQAKREGKTIILVTHSMENVRQFCNKAILIDAGKITAMGNPDKVASQYSNLFITEDEAIETTEDTQAIKRRHWPIKLDEINLLKDDKAVHSVAFREDFTVRLVLTADQAYKKVRLAFDFIDQAGTTIVNVNTDDHGGYSLETGKNIVEFNVQNVFSNGDYYVNLTLRDLESNQEIYKEPELCTISVVDTKLPRWGVVHPNVRMKVGS